MRKRISSQPQRESPSENTGWLDLEALARVEVTSEDAAYPIESALLPVGATGWRAQSPGEQTIRLLFEAPQRLRRIRLLFREEKEARTQEFVLRWSPTVDGSSREILRQQYHFSLSGATEDIVDAWTQRPWLIGRTNLAYRSRSAQASELHWVSHCITCRCG